MDDKWVYRGAIVMTAHAEVLAGSHYLLGADGGVPQENGGAADGLKQRKIQLLNVNNPDSVAIETAKYSDRLCHGRLDRVGGFKLPIGKKEYLHDYLKQYCPEESWRYGLTPRSLNWTTVMVGESCRGKRHFDCIFFVNWVLTKALMRPTRFTYNIEQWSNPNIAPVKRLNIDEVSADTVMNGDIFINLDSSPQHIGFFTAGGKTLHASGADRGVIQGDFEKAKFTHVVRLKDSALKFG